MPTQQMHDIFMKALREVNPEMGAVMDFLQEEKEDKGVVTFEDCAAVEADIYERLGSVSPNTIGRSDI